MAAVAVVSLGIGLLVRVGSQGSEGRSGGHRYRLALPHTLDAGTYTLSQNTSGDASAGLGPDGGGPGMRDMTALSGSYKGSAGAAAHELLDVDGAYGTVDDPGRAVSGILGFMADSGEGEVAVPAARITPAGAEEPLTCEVLKSTSDSGAAGFLPMCACADSDTVAAVAVANRLSLAVSTRSVDLTAFAERVNTIRNEVRVPRS